MCKDCKKLLELYAETQLECLKRNRSITKVMTTKCEKCGNDIYIVVDTISNSLIYFDNPLIKNGLVVKEKKDEWNKN